MVYDYFIKVIYSSDCFNRALDCSFSVCGIKTLLLHEVESSRGK